MAPRPPAELEQQAARNAGVRALAARQLASVWPRVDWSSDLASQAVTTLYRAVVAQFGATSASLAADFYDDLRAGQGLRRRYRASVADPVNDAQVRRIVTSAFLGTDEPLDVHQRRRVRVRTSELPVEQRVPQRLEQSLSRLVMQPARETIARNTEADPANPGWIRIPTGPTTCEFCITLASRQLGRKFRGYRTEGDALFKNGEKFHTECDCEAVAVFPGDDVDELSPNMAEYFAIYNRAANAAGTRSDFKAVLAEMRKELKASTASDEQPEAETSATRPVRAVVPAESKSPPRTASGTATPPPAPPRTPPPPAADDDEPQGWSGHVKGYAHPHRTPVWTEDERVRRQAALGDAVVPEGEQLYQHEIEATERLHALGEVVQWIPLGEPDEQGRRPPTNDFEWVTNGGGHAELKSTSAKYSTISERIRRAVLSAAEKGVVKDHFVIDIGRKALKPVLRQQLARYNSGGDAARRITALWVLTRGELVQIELE